VTQTFDLTPGAVLTGGSRTVTDAEIALLPAIMGAISPLFHDEERAKTTPMGSRILYGPAVLGIGIALTEHLLRDRVVALLEIMSVRFRRPVRVGDTLTASLRVNDLQPREGRAGLLLTTGDEVHNQAGELIMTFSRKIVVRH